jgi:protein arginine N-methyltransferase 1
VRTLGYKEALERNAALFKDKVVLDVGCGTGILSMIAARAGASHVIGVDASGIIEEARHIVRANGLEDKVSLVRGTMETITLPRGIEKVDLIISEWMGYALLYESMLPTVLWARDRYLRDDGLVLPSSTTLLLALSSHDRLAFWSDVYGFDMASIGKVLRREVSVEVAPAEALLSAPSLFHSLDCTAIADNALDFTRPFSLTASAAGPLRSFILHFDTIFDCSAQGGCCTQFTTSCEATPTHWKQSVLHLENPIELASGDVVAGEISFSRGLEYKRGYNITVTYAHNGGPSTIQFWMLE